MPCAADAAPRESAGQGRNRTMHARTTWLSESEKSLIVEQALHILEHTGMRLVGSKTLPRLAEAGAAVDGESGLVRFPPELVTAALASCPREFVLAGATPERDAAVSAGAGFLCAPSGCAAHALDLETGRRRESTLEDLRTHVAVLDELEQLDLQWTAVTANDVPREQRELLEYLTILRETDKHVTFVDCPTHVDEVRRIFEVLSGDIDRFRARPRISTLVTTASPLQVDGDILDVHLATASWGAPLFIYTMAIAGATAPVTVIGTLVQCVAEFLGVATAMQTMAPGARVIWCSGSGVLDMRNGIFSLGCLENTLMASAAVEMGHHLGVPVLTPGLTTDAKHSGVQAGWEKGLKLFPVCATGTDLISGGMGLIDSARTLFLPQAVIDDEIVAWVRRMLADVEVSDETMAADAIAQVGPGGNFLGLRETRTRIRAGEHFVPVIASRLAYEAWEAAGVTEVDVARARVDEILRTRAGREPDLSEDQLAELATICGE
jgi:trimethylamine--corrinoid protein Co-methyltransferase